MSAISHPACNGERPFQQDQTEIEVETGGRESGRGDSQELTNRRELCVSSVFKLTNKLTVNAEVLCPYQLVLHISLSPHC